MRLAGEILFQIVTDLEGEQVPRLTQTNPPQFIYKTVGEGENAKRELVMLTVKQVLRSSLTTDLGKEMPQPEDDERKTKNYKLAKRIMAVPRDGHIDIPTPEVSHIILKLKRVWGQEVAGFVEEILEGETN